MTLSPPIRPGSFLPLKTLEGVAHCPIAPARGGTWRRGTRAARETVPLYDAGETLALADADDVGPVALGEVDHYPLADLVVARVERAPRPGTSVAAPVAFLKWPFIGMLTACRRFHDLAEAELHRLVAVLIGGLELRDHARPDPR